MTRFGGAKLRGAGIARASWGIGRRPRLAKLFGSRSRVSRRVRGGRTRRERAEGVGAAHPGSREGETGSRRRTATDLREPLVGIGSGFRFRARPRGFFVRTGGVNPNPGTMNKSLKWHKNRSGGFLHERFVCFSLLFLLVVLGSDCFFQNLPVSGYGLVVATLVLVGCATCFTCHGIKWIIQSDGPLLLFVGEKSESKKWVKLLTRCENDFLRNLFGGGGEGFRSFKYPTNVNEQVRLLIKDVERDFIRTWYSEISQNPSFLFDSHLILEEIFLKIIKKLKTVNGKNVILSVLILYLNHLQEYKKSVKKRVRLSDDGSKPKIDVPDLCRYSHPGSQSDQILNYYLKKVAKSLLKEFASHDFAGTLECKILSGVIGRKVFRRLLTTTEDPDWINFKLIHVLNGEKYGELLGKKVYVVKEKAPLQEEEEFQFRKSALLSKRYFDLSSDIFESRRTFFERNEFRGEDGPGAGKNEAKAEAPEKEFLTLPLRGPETPREEARGNISTVLSGLLSSTAGPLLPDNVSVRCGAFNKMWQSPVSDVDVDVSESAPGSARKTFDGAKDKKGIFRSRSTESLSEASSGSLRSKDVSVGEELCESVRFGSVEANRPPQKSKKLTKTRSFDGDDFATEDPAAGDGGGGAASPADGDPGGDDRRDVSPVYEEPEDFATTIAKLRSLLQQRESSSTLSDKSSHSVDSQAGLSTDKSESSSRSWEGEQLDSRAACEVPTDGRLFVNVCVPKGELVVESGGSPFVLYTVQYDGIYVARDSSDSSDQELVLQTTVVKRRFQEFLHLQAKLEENGSYKAFMKGVRGPSKWVQSNFGARGDDPAASSRRALLECFLRQLCSKVEISNSQELHEFLGYGQTGNDSFIKKDASSSPQRIDKLLANKVTGVFNSIKTALPSFDFDSAALVATNDSVKGFQEQKLLQNFLNFGNKAELFELDLDFVVKEPTGESFADDVRNYLNEKSDCIEDAVDVLDSSDWLSDKRECRLVSAEEKCVWHGYRDAVLEDELEPLDSWLPIYSLLLDIACELLQDSDSWAIKEPVIRVAKVISGHWEEKLRKELSALDWDRIFANAIRLSRGLVFQPEEGESVEATELESKKHLKEVILELVPDWITEFVKDDGVTSAVSLFVDSFQHFRLNRDVLLRLMDILLAHLLSCHHLTGDSKT